MNLKYYSKAENEMRFIMSSHILVIDEFIFTPVALYSVILCLYHLQVPRKRLFQWNTFYFGIKRPSHDKQFVNMLATNKTCLYSRQLFHQLFRVGKLVFDVWTIAKRVLLTLNMFARQMLLCLSHTPAWACQHEFASFSVFVWRPL